MSGKKVLRFRDAEVAPVRVTIVGDWRAITPKDMLRNNVLTHFDVEAAKAVEAAREKRRREWCAGLTHVMTRIEGGPNQIVIGSIPDFVQKSIFARDDYLDRAVDRGGHLA